VFTDQLSGLRDDRPGVVALLEYVRYGDTVVVTALGRLGRSLSGVIRTIETHTAAGVLLRSLREGIDYSTPTGRMLAGIFAALAGYERELMHERVAAARAAARARGGPTGRPRRLTRVQARQVQALRAGGESINSLVGSFGCPARRSTEPSEPSTATPCPPLGSSSSPPAGPPTPRTGPQLRMLPTSPLLPTASTLAHALLDTLG